MEEIINNLWVGDDNDYLKVKDKKDFSILRCCKYGPGGHQETLGYKTLAAPPGANYLSVDQRNRRALNFIDPSDSNFIPVKMVEKGLDFVDKRLAAGDKVLIACNAGHSRGPTTGLLYLRAIGDLTGNFHSSESFYRKLYRKYDPGLGCRTFAQSNWDYFKNYLRKGNNGQ